MGGKTGGKRRFTRTTSLFVAMCGFLSFAALKATLRAVKVTRPRTALRLLPLGVAAVLPQSFAARRIGQTEIRHEGTNMMLDSSEGAKQQGEVFQSAINAHASSTQTWSWNATTAPPQPGCPVQPATLQMRDSYGDGWNGAEVKVTSCDAKVIGIYSFSQGSSSSATVCVPTDHFIVSTTLGSYPTEVSWTLSLPSGQVINGDATEHRWVNCWGWTPPPNSTLAPPPTTWAWTPAPTPWAPPTPAPMANTTLSPPQPGCPVQPATLQMRDSYGDGWNGAELKVTSCDAKVIGIYSFSQGSSSSATVCVPSLDFQVSVTPGSYPTEVSWTLSLPWGQVINGGAPYQSGCGGGQLPNATEATPAPE